MTPMDRAKQVIECRHQDLLVYEIEQAITAAIEEDRRARECCKVKVEEERDACRLIADAERKRMHQRQIEEGEGDMHRALLTVGAGRMAALIEALIRARSDVKS